MRTKREFAASAPMAGFDASRHWSHCGAQANLLKFGLKLPRSGKTSSHSGSVAELEQQLCEDTFTNMVTDRSLA